MLEYIFLASIFCIAFTVYLRRKVLALGEGTDAMKAVSSAIREGATAFLHRQYKTVAIYFGAVEVVLVSLVATGYLTIFVPFAFLTGGFFSLLSGYLGMRMATAANARTAHAASESLNKGLRAALSAGSIMGFLVVGLGLLDIASWFTFLNWYER